MIVELDANPNNSIKLVTEDTDFPSLDLKHIDAASLYNKIIQLMDNSKSRDFVNFPQY